MKWNLHSVLAIILVAAVSLLGVSPELFHHHEETCHKTHENEQVDSCHISIHHGTHQCEDHDHIAESEYCAACNLFLAHTPIAEPFLLKQLDHFQTNIKLLAGEAQQPAITFHTTLRLRGPPFIGLTNDALA
ncbi:MAG: hypothetical protein Salg2KO_13990 [Salibacteraceae bacterium]